MPGACSTTTSIDSARFPDRSSCDPAKEGHHRKRSQWHPGSGCAPRNRGQLSRTLAGPDHHPREDSALRRGRPRNNSMLGSKFAWHQIGQTGRRHRYPGSKDDIARIAVRQECINAGHEEGIVSGPKILLPGNSGAICKPAPPTDIGARFS